MTSVAIAAGRASGHPTPHVDQLAKEGAMFTSWYGQASCTAGRASFMTGRIPIRSALSIVVAPGDRELATQGDAHHRRVLQEERLHKPTSRANGTWATSPTSYPIEHGFDEMKSFARLLSRRLYLQRHQLAGSIRGFPSYNPEFSKDVFQHREHVRVGRRRGQARKEGRARSPGTISPSSISTADRFGDRIHQGSTPRMTSRSSWT